MNLFLIISSFDVELTIVATAVTFYDGKRSVRPLYLFACVRSRS